MTVPDPQHPGVPIAVRDILFRMVAEHADYEETVQVFIELSKNAREERNLVRAMSKDLHSRYKDTTQIISANDIATTSEQTAYITGQLRDDDAPLHQLVRATVSRYLRILGEYERGDTQDDAHYSDIIERFLKIKPFKTDWRREVSR